MEDFQRWLSISDRYTKMYLDSRLSPLGLNSSQHMYILRICDFPGITQDQFIHFFHINPSNVTRSLTFLVNAGYIRKEQNTEDKRTCRLYPTEKAKQAKAEILSVCETWKSAVLEDFTEEERTLFLNLLQRTGRKIIELMGTKSNRNVPALERRLLENDSC